MEGIPKFKAVKETPYGNQLERKQGIDNEEPPLRDLDEGEQQELGALVRELVAADKAQKKAN